MAFSRALPNSVLVRFLCSLILWFASEQVLALGCTAASYTYTNNGTNTNYSLSSGQSLKISRGIYAGNINNFPSNATICVESGATFSPSNLSNPAGTLINYGTANLATFSYNSGTVIDNYGLIKFTSGLNFNGATTIRNRSNATIITENSFTLANASLLENDGLIIAKQDFNTNSGTTINNNYRLEAEGNFNPSGVLTNYGRIYAKKFINANSDFSFNNYCTLISYEGFNNNSLFFSNWGTILVSSTNGVPGGLWQNNQSFYNGDGAKVAGGSFTNNGSINGYGALIFSGETRNQGTFVGSSAANSINFYDETQTGSLLFDYYNLPATNTIRTPFARPTELDAPTSCNNTYKSFASLNACPAGGVINNQVGTVAQASGNGAAVENVSQAIGALQALNATATASNSAKIIAGGVLTLDLGQVVPADTPISISLARVDTARVRVEVSLDGVVFSSKGTFGSSGSLGTSSVNILARLVINANPGGTQYIRLIREAGSMWVDGAEYSQTCIENRDYGDAPASYGVAAHKLAATNLYLGASVPDTETASAHSVRANGDGNDEDGPPPQAVGAAIPDFTVLQMTDMSYSTTVRTTNQTGTVAKLTGWIDFDKNGSFDTDERASVDVPTGSNNTNTTLTWASIPTDITLGTTYVRLRFTTDATAALQATGTAANGEVEDFILPIHMDIPPNSPSISIATASTPLACQSVVFQDDFNDLTPAEASYWGVNRAGAVPVRSWTSSGGGVDTYARFTDWGLGYGTSIYFGNGDVRNISPSLGSGFSFDTQGKLLTTIDALALRDSIDDLDVAGTIESHWGVLPVSLSRSFATTVGKTYRLYFSALRETGDFLPGIMRVDAPGGAIHFKAPGGTEGILDYAIDFTATSSNSSISFVNYGHFGPNSNGYCNVVNNAWCTVGGLDNNGKTANELSIDNVKLVEAACATGGIGGYVYQDSNLNNTYDMGTETTIPAITVKIYDEKASPSDFTDDRLVATQTSFADGHYLFQQLDANASYRVEIDLTDPDLPASLTMGTPNPFSGLVPLVNGTKTANFGLDPAGANGDKDYGDAPATYGVPQHTVSSGFYLGSTPPDSELNQAAPLNGSSDDATGIDDEDGVMMPSLTQGQTATIELPVTGVGGYLQAWFDWNGDGDFADSGEQIASNLQDNLVGDTNNTANRIAFPVSVPTTATSSATYARFRWSTTLGLDSTAAANNGEVEDYAVTISPASNMPTIIGEYRFDDCGSGGWQLDSSGHNNSVIGAAQIQIENYKNYACTAVSNPNWNIEVPHQANYALASGAVSILFYDHKGVWANARLLDKGWTADQKLSLEMKPSTDWQHGTVSANLNGNIIDTGETYYTSLGNGSLNDTQWVHAVLSFGPAGMKLYINGVLKGSNPYTGGITGVQGNFRLPGVEGYFDEFYVFNQQPTDAQVSILYSNLLANKTWDGNTRTCNCSGGVSADYGDAPASYGEVSHKILSSIYLGENPPDAETASKYSFNARADNYDDGAPQQAASGVYIPLFPVLQLTDSSYSVNFKVTNLTGTAGKLHGWIDFDKSGTFEADEAAVVDVPSGASNATATLNWTSIPLDIQLGTVALRLRLSTDASVVVSTPTGSANDGEVEDYPIAIAMDIPPNSPSLAIVNGATPAACEVVVFQDNFNDLTPGVFWGLNRPGSQAVRDWDRSGGGNDTYAHITSSSATERSIYFGNGGVRQISPSIGTGFSFDANGKLLTVIDAIALRDDMDDIITPGTTVNEYGSKADWGPEPVKFSRSFATVAGKTYRLYFTAKPEDPAGTYESGIMRLDMPGGSLHFKAPGSAEGVQSYAVEFTANSASSAISFINYGHVENDNNKYCDPNSVFNNNVWCTVGGRTDGKVANELIIDDVVLTEAACATGSIRGRVYLDSDQDNNYDAGIEAGLNAITVSLYDENGTPGNYSDDRLVNTNSTYVNGEYYFTEVNTSRSYRLEVDTTDSDLPVHTVIGTTNPLTNRTVVANTLLDHQHFGFDLMTPSKIVGTVYLDNNTNDSFNPGIDYGIGNITVSLHTMAGALVASTQTAVNGKYQFANLDHNLSYRITVDGTDTDLPPGATLGTVNPIPNISVPQNSTVTKDVGFDQAANGITGKVFLDYNLNGQLDSQSAMSNFANNMNIGLAFDKGIANAQVKAECVGAAGKLSFGPVTSDVNGQYYLATPGAVAGNYNCILQLTTLPSGYTVATQSGSGQQVLTQVVSPNAVNTYFALQQEMSYCQNNPDLAVNRFAYGQQTANAPFAGNNDVANIFAFPYNSGTAGVPNTLPSGYDHPLETDNAFKDLALANQVGSVFGLGWHPSSHSLFASAYMKAWTGFGSGGTGGIYRVDLSNPSSPVSSLYANLNQIFPATPPTVGSDPYLTGIFSSANPGYVQIADGSSAPDGSYVASGNATRDNQDGQIAAAVGKTAFGDLDVSADGKSLFVVNMANNKLYILPVRSTALTAADAGLISSYNIPFAANCRVNGTKRAFGLGEFEGGVYVATQCGTEQGQIWEVPEHAIFRFDLQSKTFSTTPSLVYARSSEDSYGIDFSLITDIVFDPAGQMILTFRNALESPYGTTADNGKGSAYSVIRRACIQDKAAYRWEKENNASCGGVTTPGKDAGYGTGPSSGTFFYQEYPADNGPALRSASYGGAAQIPGFMEAAYTIAEPFEFYSVGVSWVDTGLGNPATAGQRNRAYGFYKGTGAFEYPDNRPVNGKNAAIGDLEVLCDTPSLEIGNRVWQDSDNDGVQDAGEPPVAGVKVELFANGANLASATPLATAVTDANGYYAFSSDMRGYPATGNNAPNDTTGANGGFNAADIQGGRASTASHKYGLLSLTPNTQYQVVIRNVSGASKQASLGSMTLSTAAQGTDPELDSDASVVGDHAVSTVSMLGYGNHYHAVDFGFKGVLNIQPPFVCTNTLYQGLGNPSQLAQVNIGSGITLSNIGSPYSSLYNAMGYRKQDNYIYAIKTASSILLRIGSDGSVVELGSIGGLPDTVSLGADHVRADFNDTGDFMVYDAGVLYTVNVTATPPIVTASQTFGDSMGVDIAFNSTDSKYYGVPSNGTLAIADPLTGAYTRPFTTVLPAGSYGAIYFDTSGALYAYRNSGLTNTLGQGAGGLYRVDVSTGNYTFLGFGPAVNQNDGASCRGVAPLAMGSVSGVVYRDDNASDAKDGSELGLENITVNLYFENGTPADTSDDTLVSTSYTDNNGNYSFININASAGITYRIQVDTADTDLPVGATIGTSNPLTNRIVSAGTTLANQNFGFDITTTNNNSIAGKVFEDVNYGGGAGRPLSTAGAAGVLGVRVELYNSTGNFVTSTTTADGGPYSFGSLANGTYYVRVVNDTIRSTRAGSDASERSIQTFRSDGTSAVTNEVGGRKPALVDAAANTTSQTLNISTFVLSGGGQAQSVQPVTVSGSSITGADFGFNFSTVININNSGQGSLRQAILNANLLANSMTQPGSNYGVNTALTKEVLVFNIPASGDPQGRADICSGTICNITVNSKLPDITAPLIIDGATQPGYTAGTPGVPRIRIAPAAGLDASGISIAYTATDSTVRGLSITGFRTSSMNRAINVAAARTVVESNYLGVKPDGTADANGQGIMLEYADTATTVIGGSTAAKRNIISGNLNWGIAYDTGATAGTIQNNFIGTNVAGTAALGNQFGGVDLESANDTLILDNLIAGNAGDGLQIGFTNGTILTSGYTIRGNRIGVGINGEAIGNTGPGIMNYGGSSNHQIGGTTVGQANIIANNMGGGIKLVANSAGVNNIISGNSFYANGNLGIDLGNNGVTVNDANDTDAGANNLLNFPLIAELSIASGNLSVKGCAPGGATVELFEADVSTGGKATPGDNKVGKSKDYGEGQIYLASFVEGSGSDTDAANCALATDADGNNQTGLKAFSVTIPAPAAFVAGDTMTATATLAGTGTSEFSPVFTYNASCSLIVTTTADTDNMANNSGSLRDAIECANSTPGVDSITFNMPNTETGFINPDGVVNNGNEYWQIAVNSQLPSITEGVSIDGRTQTSNKGNTNSGNVAAAATVGADNIALAAVAAPEVEIIGQWFGAGFDIKASHVNIYGLGMRLFDTNIRMDQANTTNILLNGLALGVNLVNGSDPGAGQRSNQHIAVNASGVGFVLTNSLLGFNDNKRGIVTGQYNNVSGVSATISGNHFIGVGMAGNTENAAIEILRTQNPNVTISGNRFVGRGTTVATDLAVEFNDYGGGNSTCVTCLVENNSISGFHDGVGYFTDASLTGLVINKNRIYSNTEFAVFLGNVQNASVAQNYLYDNGKSGVLINKSAATGNIITQNHTYNNGEVGINLAGGNQVDPGGITLNDANDMDSGPNSLLNFPILQQLVISNGNITARGCAPAGSVIEFFEADVSPGGAAVTGANRFGLSFDYGEGQFYLGSMVEGSVADVDTGDCAMPTFDGHNNTGMKAFQFSVPTPASVVEGDYLTASATLANIGTSEFGPSTKIISGPPPIGAGSCAATGGSDILFIVDNSGSITELEYADFAQTIQTVGSQLLLNNPKNRIAVAHFGGPSDSLVGGGQYVYIERDFSSTAMLAPIRQFAWGGAYNSTWIADHLAGALQQMRYALDGQTATTSSYILSPLKETSRNTASPLQIVLMTDAARYLDAVPSDISMLIDPPGSGAEPDDGSVFTVYNQMKAEGVAFSVASFNADPTDIAASAAIASVGGTYTGAIEANIQDPQGSQVAPRRYVSVTAGFQLTSAQLDELVEGTAICSRSIQGRIFEDPNYGGGAGRPFGTAGTVGLAGASIEVYDASGHYVASVTSSTDGQYTLPNLPNATYYVRVVDASVISSRLGSNGSEIPVLTYRTDGLVATATQVGGNHPLLVDAGTNPGTAILNTTNFLFSGGGLTGKPAQSVQSINLSGSSVKGVDFGFNFSTVVNTNDAGQGSLRQFLLNNKLLSTDALTQALPITLATDYPAGTETSIFMIPLTQLTNGEAIINLTSGSLSLERANTSIDGRTQVANMGSGVIVLKNSTSNGLTLMPTATASVVRDLTVSHAAGSGVVIDAADNTLIQRVVSINNSQYGISLSNEALNNRVLTNTIANNTWAGIAHLGNGIGNTYSQNSIRDNGGLGIDLGVDGVTANDNLDSDTGANKLLNYPEVAAGSSISSNGTKVLAYDFDLDVPNNTHGYRVEFFRNTVVDSSKQGEGEIYLGYVDLNHAGGGVLNFKGSFNANQTVPADANIAVTLTEKTSPTTLGSTSEFSGVRNGKVSVCTDLINGSGAEMTINENAAVITYLEATDENGNPITYVISGGADGNQFIVQDPAPGASLDCQMIVFRKPNIIGQRSASITKAALLPKPGDYEAPSDSGGDNTYNLDLTATVNGKAYVRSVSVGVQDINESPSIINEAQTEFLEGKTGVALNIESYDQDVGDEEGKGISYAISGGVDRARFNINPKNGELSFISPPDFEAPLDTGKDNIYDLEVRVMDAQGLSGVSSLKIAVTDDTQNDGINLQTKVLLQGPYMASNGLMQDNLRVLGLLPVTQPYSASPFNYMGSEQLNLDLATVTGKDALVDWVLIELRAANDPNTILARKAAFVQRDGDVVDSSTGSSALNFKLAAGDYFVSLRHRNHLGVRTASPISLSSTAVVVDFSRTTTKVFGTAARLESTSLALLWAGDVNHDERLIASGISNDSGEIFKKVLKAPANLNLNSNYRLTSYLESDLNMDGDTLFIGPGNDTNILLGNVLLFPTNVSKNSNYIVMGGLAK